jgi:hypothetical protein
MQQDALYKESLLLLICIQEFANEPYPVHILTPISLLSLCLLPSPL